MTNLFFAAKYLLKRTRRVFVHYVTHDYALEDGGNAATAMQNEDYWDPIGPCAAYT